MPPFPNKTRGGGDITGNARHGHTMSVETMRIPGQNRGKGGSVKEDERREELWISSWPDLPCPGCGRGGVPKGVICLRCGCEGICGTVPDSHRDYPGEG